jgi:peptide/nickel transport system ATP-binding protein
MRRFRWDKISMVFQGAMNALNPVSTIGAQLDDVFVVHRPSMSRAQRRAAVIDLLETSRSAPSDCGPTRTSCPEACDSA